MTTLNSYLIFNGNCRQAMEFYKKCLGGQLWFQTVGESPLGEKMPDRMKQCIVHSTLKSDGLLLMGSDIVNEKGLMKGNAVSLMLSCGSQAKMQDYYQKLSQGGLQTHPLQATFWGTLFGGITDQFGNHWLLSYQKKMRLNGS